jgi:hypothetical protein
MNAIVPLASPDPAAEHELATRLLAALEDCRTDEIEVLQGMIIGRHFAKLRTYVAAHVSGVPRADAEEVFAEATAAMFLALFDPKTVAWVEPGRSFSPLFFKIAGREVAEYWRGRPPYKEDRRARAGIDAAALAAADRHAFRRWLIEEATDADGGAVNAGLAGLGGLDGLLLELTAVCELTLKQVEGLLRLAEEEDGRAAIEQASALLDVNPILAEQYLTLVRECPTARQMSYGALKVAVHRARRRAQGVLREVS